LIWLGALAVAGIVICAVIMLRALREVRRHEEVWATTLRLTEQNRELDAFAGRVAHDLRGPLTTISLAAGRLTEKMPEANSTGAILRRGITRMDTLIRDLLTLSRVDAPPADEASDPVAVAATVAEDFGPPTRSAGGSLDVEVDPSRVRCSEGLLRDVVGNLVENALKYRGLASPKIRVEGHPREAMYELRVSDNGIGMSEEEAQSAFDAFYRGPRAPREVQGTGLGLSIVKRIVDVCGGTIAVDSKPGHGTTFVVDLPLARPV
jgi:signal transduction histidine kinase